MESNHAAGGNRHFFAGFGVAAGALRFVAQLEIAEAGNFDFFTALKRGADFFKKSSTISLASFLLTLLTFSTKMSASSALVMVMMLPSGKCKGRIIANCCFEFK